MSPIEVIGVLAGLGYVVFAIRESAWCWPSGIVSAAAYVVFFQAARLPGQAALQAILGAICAYGWWAWSRKSGTESPLVVSKAKPVGYSPTPKADRTVRYRGNAVEVRP